MFRQMGLDEKLYRSLISVTGIRNSEDDQQNSSNAERGSKIHDLIARMIRDGMKIPSSATTEETQILDWVRGHLVPMKADYTLESEVELKFPFFGQTISGTPDIVLRSKSGADVEIWDFKTGPSTDHPSYWAQLHLYAWAVYCLVPENIPDKFILKLCHVDSQEISTRECPTALLLIEIEKIRSLLL
jgi:hypothetical protein